ncbi:MAG: cyclic lactone autoinducer peptide [Lachnospiraceae bacterium]|nr:cyclic lactone autoinducer peptide [Lachnospiraceae bacterium]
MNKLNVVAMNVISKAALLCAKKETQSACLCLGYQPKMPQKVKDLATKSSIRLWKDC